MIYGEEIINLNDLREKLLNLGPEERKTLIYLIRHIFNRYNIIKSIESRYRKRHLLNVDFSRKNFIEFDLRVHYKSKNGRINHVKIFNNKIIFVINEREYEHKIQNLYDVYILGFLLKSSLLKNKYLLFSKIDFPIDSLVISK
jgi:hypothetical protein